MNVMKENDRRQVSTELSTAIADYDARNKRIQKLIVDIEEMERRAVLIEGEQALLQQRLEKGEAKLIRVESKADELKLNGRTIESNLAHH